MAKLTDVERRIATKQWILKVFVEPDAVATLTSPDIKAAMDAADDWAEAQAAAYNAALPQPFRGAATADQKAILLAAVCMRRAGWWPWEESS
jgi:hypothetical protein